jgi:peptide/nickel transport system permease protein
MPGSTGASNMPDLMRRALKSPQLVIGGLLLLAIMIVIVLGPTLAPHDPETFNARQRLQGPSAAFWLGTDQYGRDILSRVLIGARATVLFGLIAAVLGTVLGLAIGVASGYAGGHVDEVVMRLMDALMAMPTLLKALLIVTVLGPNAINATIAVGIAFAPALARIARGSTLAVRNSDYVAAAIARGEGTTYILAREVTPNVVAPVIVESSIRIAFAIMIGATLGFLGLGAQPPAPDWGLMVAEARGFMFRNPWMVAAPGCAIALVAVAFNLVGDGLRDLLNPRLAR